MRILGTMAVFIFIQACAASIGSPELDLSNVENRSWEIVQSTPFTSLSTFTSGSAQGRVEWYSCEKRAASEFVLMINPDSETFESNFCNDWHAQAFMSAGYSVIGVNRPGFGKSQPNQDFSGPITVSAITAALKAARAKHTWFSGHITGVWAVQSGAIAATFWAKSNPTPYWMILGNGIFDLEEFRSTTKSNAYLQSITAAQGKIRDDSFNEARSIAWDTSGLPKKILLYHGQKNVIVPMSQSASFRDTLAAEEIQVRLEPIPESGHEFNSSRHRIVLEALLKRMQGPSDIK